MKRGTSPNSLGALAANRERAVQRSLLLRAAVASILEATQARRKPVQGKEVLWMLKEAGPAATSYIDALGRSPSLRAVQQHIKALRKEGFQRCVFSVSAVRENSHTLQSHHESRENPIAVAESSGRRPLTELDEQPVGPD